MNAEAGAGQGGAATTPSTQAQPPAQQPQPGKQPTSASERSQSLANAAAAHAEFERTGKKPDAPTNAKPVPAKPDKADKPAAPAKPAAADKPAGSNGEPDKGGIGAIKAKAEKQPTAADAEKERVAKEKLEKEGTLPEDKAKEQTRWKELKAKEAELDEIKPQWEATKKAKEEWEKERAKNEESLKELEQLRRERDFKDFTKSDRYQKEVETPYQKVVKNAMDVAEYAKVELKDLMKAMQEPNPLKRAKDIKAVLEAGKEEIADISTLVTGGQELLEIFAKHDELEKNATLLKEQHENGQKAEKLKAETEAIEISQKAHKEIQDILKNRASDVLDDDTLKEVMDRAIAQKSDDPMDRAFRGQAEFLVPVLIEKNRALAAELETLKTEKKDEREAKPGVKPDAAKPGAAPKYASLKEAYAEHKQVGAQI